MGNGMIGAIMALACTNGLNGGKSRVTDWAW
jgi:hypothetical protein